MDPMPPHPSSTSDGGRTAGVAPGAAPVAARPHGLSPNGRPPTRPAGDAPELLPVLSSPRSPTAEAYRALRTSVQFSGIDREVRTIVVASPNAGEGRSTIVANLAAAFAETGRPVILVDADLRRPTLHTLFGLPNDEGLSTALLSDADAPLPLLQSEAPGLRLLPSGPEPANPAELIGSRAFEHLLSRLRAEAEYVLFDSPPAAALADASMLAARVDGVLLVVRAGHTRREPAQRARDQLERVRARLLGVVLNGVAPDAAHLSP